MSKVLTIRMSDELYERIVRDAHYKGLKVSPFVEDILDHCVEPIRADGRFPVLKIADELTGVSKETMDKAVERLQYDIDRADLIRAFGEDPGPMEEMEKKTLISDIITEQIVEGTSIQTSFPETGFDLNKVFLRKETPMERRRRLHKLGSND